MMYDRIFIPLKHSRSNYFKDRKDPADQLLHREPEEEYLNEWEELLAKSATEKKEFRETTALIFRLFQDWFAVSNHIVAELSEKRPIHRIPSRTNEIFMGVANLRGQLRLCVALHHLLDIQGEEKTKEHALSFPRMLAISSDSDYWIFPISEAHGIYQFNSKEMENVPVTLAKSQANYLKGVIRWENKTVGYLDEELLFSSLKRSFL